MEQAMARGQEAGGLALDFSKAYDRIVLEFPSKVAEAARMPKWLVAPMLDMYKAPRQARIMDTYGGLKVPTHGLAPGCPSASFWMAICISLDLSHEGAQYGAHGERPGG